MPEKNGIHDQIILGSGPAGYTAAIYARAATVVAAHIRAATRRPAHRHHPGGKFSWFSRKA
ncbi:MAG: hypothetical protein R2864_07595 [Syntrophotaleaceae bacterium]